MMVLSCMEEMMRHFVLSALFCCAAAFAQAGDAPSVHNIALSFADFYDANKDKPDAQQLAAFKRDVASGYPAFYGVERYKGEMTQAQKDQHILKTIKAFPAIREDYLRKTQQFETELPRYIASFKAWFPDFQPTRETWVLHSLGEMDGGTRTLDGKDVLIFGIDGMVRYHGKGNESAFFHHELFHTYHDKAMAGCNGDEEPMWAMLWQEGLATYVSHAMNPEANDAELLLTFPDNMAERTRKVLPAAFADLEKVLDTRDPKLYGELFSTSGSGLAGLPPRRGYYLGYLVAQEAARQRSVQELAKLDCQATRALVTATVAKLRAVYPQ
jgi:hypothetical protein